MTDPANGSTPAYERQPYRRELEVEILEVAPPGDSAWAILDDTILYPEGGGQPSDRGRLDESAILEVRRVEGRIRHYLDLPAATGKGRLTLDWERRYDHMQQHTAQHLLTAVATAVQGWATTAFHLGAKTSSIDLSTPPPPPEELDLLERAVLEEIAGARPVTSRRVSRREFDALLATGKVRSRRLPADHRGEVRLVEIAGLDVNTCGGTHLASVQEIATLKLLAVEPAHGGCRLSWVAGDRVRRRLAQSEERTAELRRLFETSADELPQVARLKLGQLKEAERRLRGLEGRYAEAAAARLAAALAAGAAPEDHFDDADGGFLQRVARAFSTSPGPGLVLLTASGAKGDFFALAAGRDSTHEVAAIGATVAGILDGRGGGSGRLFQGKAGTLDRRSRAVATVAAASGVAADPAAR